MKVKLRARKKPFVPAASAEQVRAVLSQLKAGGLVLAKAPSASRPGKEHRILLGSNNIVHCTCEAWQYSKEQPATCPHLRKFREQFVAPIVLR